MDGLSVYFCHKCGKRHNLSDYYDNDTGEWFWKGCTCETRITDDHIRKFIQATCTDFEFPDIERNSAQYIDKIIENDFWIEFPARRVRLVLEEYHRLLDKENKNED